MASLVRSPVFDGLAPAIVWQHFSTFCAIPRPSKGEAALRDYLKDWAVARGLATSVDATGNLIVRKAASPGHEGAPTVVMQAHIDMVCQANAGTEHDFTRDPILPVLRDDGWLVAPNTTLGADNGIGAALMLAALEDDTLVHGPLAALFTVDEEAGMGGARGLEPDVLQGKLMINLDTEAWGEFFLGCAGGSNVSVDRPGTPEPVPAGLAGWRIDLKGLRGGHSGIDIHEGRGNAIKQLVRFLRQLESRWPALRLAALKGGTARNALPREAFATLALPADAATELAQLAADFQAALRYELAGIDEGATVTVQPCAVDTVLSAADQKVWLPSLHAAPHGVRRMSVAVPGVVETSDNLGVVDITPQAGSCMFMVRFLVEGPGVELANEIVSLFALSGTEASVFGFYPGWAPNPSSPLLATCQAAFTEVFGGDSETHVVHAGLECGIIGGKYPELDMVSFGPNIRGAHAPGESVDVASVERCWRLLRHILTKLAEVG